MDRKEFSVTMDNAVSQDMLMYVADFLVDELSQNAVMAADTKQRVRFRVLCVQIAVDVNPDLAKHGLARPISPCYRDRAFNASST